MKKLSLVVPAIALILFSWSVSGGSPATQTESKSLNPGVRRILSEQEGVLLRLETAAETLFHSRQRGQLDLETVRSILSIKEQLTEVRLKMAQDKQQRIKILEDHLVVVKQYESRVVARGEGAVTQLQTKALRLAAEARLAEIQ